MAVTCEVELLDRVVPTVRAFVDIAPQPAKAGKLRCRLIGVNDLDAVIALLGRGFPERDAAYWRRGFDRHAVRALPYDCPRFGYVMECGNRLVGVVLTLYALTRDATGETLRCNLSSWYVDEAYRPYATLLDKVAMKQKGVTFTNISAAPHTVPMHGARGFMPYCGGQFLAVPLLAKRDRLVAVRAMEPGDALDKLSAKERLLMRDHASYGCICVIGTDSSGDRPFIFLKRPVNAIRRRLGFSPLHYLQLVYCRSTRDLPRFAHALGRHLLFRHGSIGLAIDADGPIPGMPGHYWNAHEMKLKRGPAVVRHGDLAYSEFVIFGP